MKYGFIILTLVLTGALNAQDGNPFDIPISRSNPSAAWQVTPDLAVSEEDTLSLISGTADPIVRSTNPFDIDPSRYDNKTQSKEEETSQTTFFTIDASKSGDTRLVVLIFVLVMLIILSLAVSLDRKRSSDLFKSIINSNNLKSLYRESDAWTNGQSIIFYLSFFLIGAFLLWIIFIKAGISDLHLLWIGLALILCYAVRHFVMWSIATIYPVGIEVGQYNYSVMLHNIVLGILLLPLVLAIEFVPGISIRTFIYVALALFFMLYLTRQAKGMFSCISMRGFNLLYFFIYLCAVEIAPVMVLYKVIVGAM